MTCPRCRASGVDARIEPAGAWWVCFTCGSTWERRALGQLVAVRREVSA